MILFALVSGYLPFEDSNTAALYKKILSADYQVPKFLSEGVSNLIAGLLTTDPAKRLTARAIRAHPWYRGMISSNDGKNSGLGGGDLQFMVSRGCEVPDCPYCLFWREDQGGLPIEEDILEQLQRYGLPKGRTCD